MLCSFWYQQDVPFHTCDKYKGKPDHLCSSAAIAIYNYWTYCNKMKHKHRIKQLYEHLKAFANQLLRLINTAISSIDVALKGCQLLIKEMRIQNFWKSPLFLTELAQILLYLQTQLNKSMQNATLCPPAPSVTWQCGKNKQIRCHLTDVAC